MMSMSKLKILTKKLSQNVEQVISRIIAMRKVNVYSASKLEQFRHTIVYIYNQIYVNKMRLSRISIIITVIS